MIELARTRRAPRSQFLAFGWTLQALGFNRTRAAFRPLGSGLPPTAMRLY